MVPFSSSVQRVEASLAGYGSNCNQRFVVVHRGRGVNRLNEVLIGWACAVSPKRRLLVGLEGWCGIAPTLGEIPVRRDLA